MNISRRVHSLPLIIISFFIIQFLRALTVDYVISGAGPGGLSLALALQRSGHSVVLVEKRERAKWGQRPQVLGLSQEAKDYLLSLGLSEDLFSRVATYSFFRSQGTEVAQSSAVINYSRVSRAMTSPLLAHSPEYLIEIGVLEKALLQKYAERNGDIRFENELILDAEQRIRLQADGAPSESLEYRYLINAEGAHSKLLETLRVQKTVDEQWKTFFFTGEILQNADIPQIRYSMRSAANAEHATVFLVAKDGHFSAGVDLRGANFADWAQSDAQDFLREVGLSAADTASVRTQQITIEQSHLENFFLPQYRILSIGDAAHSVNPLTALGINLALRESSYLHRVLGRQLVGTHQLSARAVAHFESHMRANVRESQKANARYHSRVRLLTHGSPLLIDGALAVASRLSHCKFLLVNQ